MDPTVSVILGFAAGIVASIVAWWLVLAAFTPRLAISTLNRVEDSSNLTPCGYRYRIKIRNRQRWYAVAGISLNARLVVKGLDAKRPEVLTSLQIPFGTGTTFPVLEGRRTRERLADSERVYTLRIHELDASAEADLPPLLLPMLQHRTATIDDLLTLGSDAFIRFAVSVSHARSGYSRTYSKKFRLADMREGEFVPDSVEVKSPTSDETPDSCVASEGGDLSRQG
jgi:hypothetical protein